MRTHTFADCAADHVTRGSWEYVRRYIAHHYPHSAGSESARELIDTNDATMLVHALCRQRATGRDGEFPLAEVTWVMDPCRSGMQAGVGGDYQMLRDWCARYQQVGVLWAGEVVPTRR